MRQFKGKTAVITGAGSGIGEAIAHRLGAAGMSVVVADVDQDAADRVCRDLQAMCIAALAVHTDVSSQDSLDRLADAAWKEGAQALKASPLGAKDIPAAEEVIAAETQVHELAMRALGARNQSAKAIVYGQVIGACASCHGLHGRVWGPGAPKTD